MKQTNTITASTTDEILQQVAADMTLEGSNNYNVVISYEGNNIELDISSSPGGGEGGGYDTTSLAANIPTTSFRFAIYPEDFLNKIGKVFGSQDVKIGYTEFDERAIVHTNDEQKVKQLLADESVRKVFQSLSGYSLHIIQHNDRETILELTMQHAVRDMTELRQIFNAFYSVLTSLK